MMIFIHAIISLILKGANLLYFVLVHVWLFCLKSYM